MNIFKKLLKKYKIIMLKDQLKSYKDMKLWYEEQIEIIKEKINNVKGENK